MTRPAERPIAFSDAMIRAILAGTKTQTRRVLRPEAAAIADTPGALVGTRLCPYNADTLWVRECYAFDRAWDKTAPHAVDPNGTGLWYRASGAPESRPDGDPTRPPVLRGKWRPPMFHVRWASRITLRVQSIRVERLQDISEADARAEGIAREVVDGMDLGWRNYLWHGHVGDTITRAQCDGWPFQYSTYADDGTGARRSFSSLWQSINGERPGCSWDANPHVWVVSFSWETPF